MPHVGLPIPTASGLAARLPPFTRLDAGSRELSWDELPENYLGTTFSRHPRSETRAARRRGPGNGSGGSPGRGTDGGRVTPGVPQQGCFRLAGNLLRRPAPCLKLRAGWGAWPCCPPWSIAPLSLPLPRFIPRRKCRCRQQPRCWRTRPTAAGWQLALHHRDRRDSALGGANPRLGASHPRVGGSPGSQAPPPPLPLAPRRAAPLP